MKSTGDTRPIYHKCSETIRGHVLFSFLGRKGLRLHRGQTLSVAGKVFQACDAAVPPMLRTLRNRQFGVHGEKACHSIILKTCSALIMNHFRNFGVENESMMTISIPKLF